MPVTKKAKTNIFFKYFVAFSLIIAVSFTILGSSLMIFVSDYWQKERTSLMYENSKKMADTVRSVLDKEDMNGSYTVTKRMIASTLSVISSSIEADIFVTDLNGTVIICKERSAVGDIVNFDKCHLHDRYTIDETVLNSTGKSSEILKAQIISGDKTYYYIVGQPIEMNGDAIGYVFAVMPNRGSGNFVFDLFKMFLMSAVVAVLLSFLVAYFMTYRMLKPLQQMSKAAKHFAEGDFSFRVKVEGNDEIADLSESFNEMASSLATLEGTRRSFVANVSHELKTPMTTISGFIDGILDGTIPSEKQNYYLKVVSDEVKRLSRLVVAMLNMSKIESGDFKMQVKKYDISDQIFRIFLTFEQQIGQKKIEIIGMDKLRSVFVEADFDVIYQVIFNLVDNAVKFTNPQGYIEVSQVEEADKVYIGIKNSGAGIPTEELPKIFERFYKVDRSRSLDVKGAGLGLYIVKAMIELHGGQISVMSKENEFTEFIFWLPKERRKGNSDE